MKLLVTTDSGFEDKDTGSERLTGFSRLTQKQ